MPNLATRSYFISRKPVNVLAGYIQLFIFTYNVQFLNWYIQVLDYLEKFYLPTMAC